MIIFDTPGQLDLRAIKTFGVSSKLDKESAIGFFGTGLKYALAILMREKCDVTILTGGTFYKVDTITSHIRNDDFQIITLNKEELGFTTDLGKTWKLWQAFRELYSNTLDENGTVKSVNNNLTYVPDMHSTQIIVKGHNFEKVYQNRHDYFLDANRSPIFENRTLSIFNKHPDSESTTFYRGIQVQKSNCRGLFDYNFKRGITLTEDRTVKHQWDIPWEITNALAHSNDTELLKTMLTAEHCYESTLDYGHISAPGKHFIDTLGALRASLKDIGINPTAIALHKKTTKQDSVLPTESIELNTIEKHQLTKACDFVKNVLNLQIDKYPLIICDNLGPNGYLGRADIKTGKMYISRQCFSQGTKRVAVALLEEFTHCHHKVYDETVEQKMIYLEQIVSLGEQIQGQPL